MIVLWFAERGIWASTKFPTCGIASSQSLLSMSLAQSLVFSQVFITVSYLRVRLHALQIEAVSREYLYDACLLLNEHQEWCYIVTSFFHCKYT